MSRSNPRRLILVVFLLVVSGCPDKTSNQATVGDSDELPSQWHFWPEKHGQGDMTLTDVWGRSDGAIFVVGWYGTIFTNRVTPSNPNGNWTPMVSGTVEHLTAIYGVENGGVFGQASNVDGEMFAVGWNGTLLHYNPNPDLLTLLDPTPEDGVWEVIAGPSKPFLPKRRVDPFCPDYDGDGVPDDGGDPLGGPPDGWWSSNATCVGSDTGNCDDNCRTSPNGDVRPIVDGNIDGCLEYGVDGPNVGISQAEDPDPTDSVPADNDGVGMACDDDDVEVAASARFNPTLFDVWAQATSGTDVTVIAVGEDGALITYSGPNAAQTVVVPAFPITDAEAWTAQEDLPYRYVNDCAEGTNPLLVASDCGDIDSAGRLPPSCPAQCSPYRTNCSCPVLQNQCCSGAAGLTGAACSGPGCTSESGTTITGPAVNACDPSTTGPTAGACSTLCPGCFRRLTKTLRALAVDPGSGIVVAVGAHRALVQGTLTTLDGIWKRPDCPLSASEMVAVDHVNTAISSAGGIFHVVGSGGTVMTYNPANVDDTFNCPLMAQCGAPPGFMSGVFSLRPDQAYVVGDEGTMFELNTTRLECALDSTGRCLDTRDCSDLDGDGEISQPMQPLDNKIPENMNAIWQTSVTDADGVSTVRYWIVGASGAMVKVGFY